MKDRLLQLLLCLLCVAMPLLAQDQAGPRGPRGGGFGGAGMGLMGTVTAVADGSITLQNYLGQTYTVHYSSGTRFLKQSIDERSRPGRESEQAGGPPPQPETIQPAAIKPGVDIAVMGVVDLPSKSASANAIVLVDAARARTMRERMAGFGKTWLMGKVVSIDGIKIVVTGSADGARYTLLLDDNTSLRQRRAPATLADVVPGELLRVEGHAAEGGFQATTIELMGNPELMLPRGAPARPREPQQ